MIGFVYKPPINNAAKSLKISFANHFPRKTCRVIQLAHLPENSNQMCRRKKAGNFPAAASYTRFPKGSPRQRF